MSTMTRRLSFSFSLEEENQEAFCLCPRPWAGTLITYDMIFYAKTTSERASKGQGGNEYLDIDITVRRGKNERMLARLTARGCENEEGAEGYGLFDEKDTLLAFLPEKDICRQCGRSHENALCDGGMKSKAPKFTRYCTECGAETWSFVEGFHGWENGLCDDCWTRKYESGDGERIVCECGDTFKGIPRKEDTCPKCLKKILEEEKGKRQKGENHLEHNCTERKCFRD